MTMPKWTDFRAKRQPNGNWYLENNGGLYEGVWHNIPSLEDVQRTIREHTHEVEWTYFNDDGGIKAVKIEPVE